MVTIIQPWRLWASEQHISGGRTVSQHSCIQSDAPSHLEHWAKPWLLRVTAYFPWSGPKYLTRLTSQLSSPYVSCSGIPSSHPPHHAVLLSDWDPSTEASASHPSQSCLTAGLRSPPGSHCTLSPQSAVQPQSPATTPGVHPQTEQAYRHSGWVLVISATRSQCVCESNTITLLKSPDLMVQHGVHIPYKLPNSQSPGLGMQRYFPTFGRSFWPLKVINILGHFVPNSLLWTMSKRQHMELINKRWKGQCGRPLSPKKEQTKVGGNVRNGIPASRLSSTGQRIDFFYWV